MTPRHSLSLVVLIGLALFSLLTLLRVLDAVPPASWRVAAAGTGTALFVGLAALVLRDGLRRPT